MLQVNMLLFFFFGREPNEEVGGNVVDSGTIATNRKVMDSITYEVNGFFSLPNHSSTTMAQESTQSENKMSARNPPGEKWQQAS
jgi:hypothetical protein